MTHPEIKSMIFTALSLASGPVRGSYIVSDVRKRHPEIVTAVIQMQLHRLVKEGEIVRPERGYYQLATKEERSAHDNADTRL